MSSCSSDCRVAVKQQLLQKLAYRLKKEGHSPLLVACDVYRPAAADQLASLADDIGVKIYRGDGKNPVAIAEQSIREAIDSLR